MDRFNSGNINVFNEEHFELETFDEVEFEGTPETFTVFVPTDLVNLSRIPDDYDYDMETSHNTFFWDELLPTLFVYCLTFVLGLVGNVLIIFTIFRYRKMKSTTNVFLASLASSDLLLILFCIPVKGLEKPAALSQLQVKTRGMSSPVFIYDEGKAFMEAGDKEDVTIHPSEEVTNPFRSKSKMSLEPFWKNIILGSRVQNETELDRLSNFERCLLNSGVNSQIEALMSKLSAEIKKCSEFIKKMNDSTKESLQNKAFVKSSKSDSTIMRWKNEYEKTKSDRGYRNVSHPSNLVFAYPLWNKSSTTEKTVNEKPARRKLVRQKKGKRGKHSEERKLMPVRRKCLEFADGPIFSSTSFCNGEKSQRKEDYCCKNCKDLKKRVICLEKEVEQIKQRIYNLHDYAGGKCRVPEIKSPREHQHSCHHHQQQQQQQQQQHQQGHHHQHHHHHRHHYQQQKQQNQENQIACFLTKTTSSETIVQKSKNLDLHLKSSTSDCHLNVGMEITMENVDPVTGEKLKGEVRRDYQQEGNIQCRLFEEGQNPLLLVNTDFEYNPLTGMLFKNKESSKASGQSTTIVLPLKTSQEQTLSLNSSRGFSKSHELQAFPCMQKISEQALGNKSGSRKCISLEHNQLGRVDEQWNLREALSQEHKKTKSQSLERLGNNEEAQFSQMDGKDLTTDIGLEEKKSNKDLVLKEKVSESELHQDARSLSAKSQKNRKAVSGRSYIPTRKKPTPSSMGNSTSGASSLSLAVSTISSVPESYFPGSLKESNTAKWKKSTQMIQKLLLKNKEKINKSSQTYAKTVSSEKENREMQTDNIELQNEEIQTKGVIPASSLATAERSFSLSSKAFPIKPSFMETASQTSQNDTNHTSPVDVGQQTELQNDEVEQYLNDLRIQKKVNLAIAELCFHLARGDKTM